MASGSKVACRAVEKPTIRRVLPRSALYQENPMCRIAVNPEAAGEIEGEKKNSADED